MFPTINSRILRGSNHDQCLKKLGTGFIVCMIAMSALSTTIYSGDGGGNSASGGESAGDSSKGDRGNAASNASATGKANANENSAVSRSTQDSVSTTPTLSISDTESVPEQDQEVTESYESWLDDLLEGMN